MRPPSRLERALLGPLVLVLTATATVLLPFAALIAALSSRLVPGRHRPLRVLLFAFTYLALEAAVLLTALWFWILAGFGRRLDTEPFVDRHYRLLRWYLRRIIGAARRLFNVRLESSEVGEPCPEVPRIVLCRHAGPGDSFLLVHAVLERGRRPRIVLRDTLRWDPLFDTLLGRLPCRFVSSGRGAGKAMSAGIADLARDMGPEDSLVIFPEGGNVTAGRRLRSIAKLEEQGRLDEAAKARELRHVMAPQTGGTLAALAASPRAQVAFVGHAGLEQLSTLVDLWRGLPMDAAVAVRTWHVSRERVPDARDEQVTWLYAGWKRIDEWISETLAIDLEP